MTFNTAVSGRARSPICRLVAWNEAVQLQVRDKLMIGQFLHNFRHVIQIWNRSVVYASQGSTPAFFKRGVTMACRCHTRGVMMACRCHTRGVMMACRCHTRGVTMACRCHTRGVMMACRCHTRGVMMAGRCLTGKQPSESDMLHMSVMNGIYSVRNFFTSCDGIGLRAHVHGASELTFLISSMVYGDKNWRTAGAGGSSDSGGPPPVARRTTSTFSLKNSKKSCTVDKYTPKPLVVPLWRSVELESQSFYGWVDWSVNWRFQYATLLSR